METTIVKSILLPKLERDPKFSEKKADTVFWEKFAVCLVHLKEDAKPIYALIYSLELDNPEKIIDKLSNIYTQFLKELAESYVLGTTTEAIDYLLQSDNDVFFKEVAFLKTMQQAIKSVERKHIEADLPKSYERLTFELSETEIANAFKKKGREDLKKKMKQWDKELVEAEAVLSHENHVEIQFQRAPVKINATEKKLDKKEPKVILWSWIKYAAAACVVFGIGIVIWQNNSNEIPTNTNTVVTTKKDTIKTKKPSIIEEPIEAIAYQEQIIQSKVQLPNDLGFAPSENDKTIKIIFKDGSNSILKLEKLVFQNHSQKVALENQLNQLKSNLEKYEFNGKELVIYTNKKPFTSILSVDNKSYFIKKDQKYFYLYFSKIPLEFKEVKSAEMIEQLEKISFENE